MLVPQFSIRWVLLFMTVGGLVFTIVRQAFLGELWAIAVTSTLLLGVATLVAFGAAFAAAYGLARATRSVFPPQKSENPFVVDGQFPPQEVPVNPFANEQK